ncbi:HEAT repeat domain-containing protein [Geitlerinema sp. P-1104]|uniref:HEAT repeat domain-containing protein n=1 Tax=Geitlerinema sp. P-1104 TaxID=2546230 RepID=UPI0014776B34|nr:HEAT repeat domain-containing protein [Geitlerinema sp. P-1104]NMG57495.1 HEAT repeat domain-containing protein [Geitlerinema sp. P-1104]
MTLDSLLADVDQADSAVSLLMAVRSLAQSGDPHAIPKLIEVLGFNNPGAAVAAVQGLVTIGEPAVAPLLEHLDGYNYGARAWAIRALAEIGDPRALDVLLKAAADFALSVRRAAARGLGTLQWQALEPSERVTAQKRVLERLLETTADPEWVVRYAAIVGLEALAKGLHDPELRQSIEPSLQQLYQEDEEAAIRGRSQLAQQRLTRG